MIARIFTVVFAIINFVLVGLATTFIQDYLNKTGIYSSIANITYLEASNYLFFGSSISRKIENKDIELTDVISLNGPLLLAVKFSRMFIWFLLIEGIFLLLLAILWPSGSVPTNTAQVGGRRRR
jgi:hypothetical protein